jgi:hypothetical protein
MKKTRVTPAVLSLGDHGNNWSLTCNAHPSCEVSGIETGTRLTLSDGFHEVLQIDLDVGLQVTTAVDVSTRRTALTVIVKRPYGSSILTVVMNYPHDDTPVDQAERVPEPELDQAEL